MHIKSESKDDDLYPDASAFIHPYSIGTTRKPSKSEIATVSTDTDDSGHESYTDERTSLSPSGRTKCSLGISGDDMFGPLENHLL